MLKESRPGLVGFLTSFGAASCCVVPMTLIALGFGAGGMMALLAPLAPWLLPVGWVGFSASVWSFSARGARWGRGHGPMPGERINLVLFILAAPLLLAATWFTFFVDG